MAKMQKLTTPRIIGLIASVILAVIPVDPTDVLDFGTPIIEIVSALLFLFYNRKNGKRRN